MSVNFYVWKIETLCECCRLTTPALIGITQCNNLRVVKHRVIKSNQCPVNIRENSRMFKISRISRNVTYDTAVTIACLQTNGDMYKCPQ